MHCFVGAYFILCPKEKNIKSVELTVIFWQLFTALQLYLSPLLPFPYQWPGSQRKNANSIAISINSVLLYLVDSFLIFGRGIWLLLLHFFIDSLHCVDGGVILRLNFAKKDGHVFFHTKNCKVVRTSYISTKPKVTGEIVRRKRWK